MSIYIAQVQSICINNLQKNVHWFLCRSHLGTTATTCGAISFTCWPSIWPSIRWRFSWLILIGQCQEKPQSCHVGKFYSLCTMFLVRPYACYCSLRLILKMLHSCEQFYCHLFTELGLVHSMPMYHGLPLSCFLHHVWLDQDLLLVLKFIAPCYSVSVFSACLYFFFFSS